MIAASFISLCLAIARGRPTPTVSPSSSLTSQSQSSDILSSGDSDTTMSSSPDAFYISPSEVNLYYDGLPSRPRLVYRTNKTSWTNPTSADSKADDEASQ
ncbi:hypothetical protein K466DRAFT_589684 [Polyporus arcularius HHB13444]|uniref:Uncharacterized protein n=1 Tax=Polyporus arcularius HHB13444 TaxID=1314778 RepID=A0A5C3P2H8_9APHY|nr:hypothetical protein K466DRAFT_589684 [Polyporus arcularius HHB13444]